MRRLGEHPRVAAASTTSRFETGAPCRLADVRDGTGFERVDRQIVRVYVTDRCGVPAAATAVALTVTVDNTATPGPGYVSIWPEGAPMPTASIVNYRSREVRANATIVRVGIGGAVDLLAQNGAPLIVDVTGWFVESAATSAGRFVPITPARATDTREPPRAAPMRRRRDDQRRAPTLRAARRRCSGAHRHVDRVAGFRLLHRLPGRHAASVDVDDQRRRTAARPAPQARSSP